MAVKPEDLVVGATYEVTRNPPVVAVVLSINNRPYDRINDKGNLVYVGTYIWEVGPNQSSNVWYRFTQPRERDGKPYDEDLLLSAKQLAFISPLSQPD